MIAKRISQIGALLALGGALAAHAHEVETDNKPAAQASTASSGEGSPDFSSLAGLEFGGGYWPNVAQYRSFMRYRFNDTFGLGGQFIYENPEAVDESAYGYGANILLYGTPIDQPFQAWGSLGVLRLRFGEDFDPPSATVWTIGSDLEYKVNDYVSVGGRLLRYYYEGEPIIAELAVSAKLSLTEHLGITGEVGPELVGIYGTVSF